MQVQVYGTLRQITGKKIVALDLPPGAALRDLLKELIRCYPALRSDLFDDDGTLLSYVPLFVNGRNPRLLPASLNIVLLPDDVVSLFSPYSPGHINVRALRDLSVSKRSEDHES